MDINLCRKQHELLKAIQSKKYRYLLFGGGMGSGKSYLLAMVFISMASNYPNTRYGIFRKNLTVLKRTTYITFKKVADYYNIRFQENRADMYWEFTNGSRIYFMEADHTKDPDFNKIKGLELTAAGGDEVNEMSEGWFSILMARIGRENNNGELAFNLMTCNPDQNWVKEKFYTPYTEDRLEAPYFYIPALPKDNPWNSKEYLQGLEDLPEAEYNRYVKGDWSYSDDPNQLIKYEWIKRNLIEEPTDIPTHMGIDVAREGNDRTVFAYVSDKEMVGYEMFRNQDTITTAAMAIERLKEKNIGSESTKVDVVGVGGGVVDYMHSRGYHVTAFNSGERPEKKHEHLLFKNKRAEAYWNIRQLLQEDKIKLMDDSELIRELLNVRYFVKDKVIQIESKSELKKRLGASPDIADAVVMAFYSQEQPTFIGGF